MNTNEYLAYLVSVPGVGRKTAAKILTYLGDTQISLQEYIQDLWSVSTLLSEKQRHNFKLFKIKYSPQNYSESLAAENIRIITPESEEYPELLKYIDDKPLVLFAKGAAYKQTRASISVVGTRRITTYGKRATEQFVAGCAAYNTTVVSGCMYGVDICAHLAAVKNNLPTVGVLGFGFNHTFPVSLKTTFRYLLDSGATLFSEFSPDTVPKPGNFPVRNRIVAGISQATVVVEAAPGSGSLITAQCALEYGRVVGAMPGPFDSVYSTGTKQLINEGAKLVCSVEDILEELSFLPRRGGITTVATHEFESDDEKKLYSLLDLEQPVDTLVESLNLPISKVNVILSTLELRGLIKRKGIMIERVY